MAGNQRSGFALGVSYANRVAAGARIYSFSDGTLRRQHLKNSRTPAL